ncbi:transcriptional regulator with XRE-family HTH domain [Silvimonas terrae]|uniref:Transcriptional regulator with XRE-family HTH domain n=1 Tax=Silvimonas terrae TaxID=300266 RepID=A0A840RE70_9NEIS|nr:hypothetical protein [Silvimonas terrae]MBB5190726.1 transcriptional regulator with XRE-family HTH domain [Silvimonas terrae]
MNTLDEILDEAVKMLGKESDRQLAIHMGVTPQSVSQWRKKISAPDMYALMQLQQILQRDARELSAIIEAERAKTEEKRGFWEGIKRDFSKNTLPVALVVATTLALSGLGEKSYANDMAYREAQKANVYYVKQYTRQAVSNHSLRNIPFTAVRAASPAYPGPTT